MGSDHQAGAEASGRQRHGARLPLTLSSDLAEQGVADSHIDQIGGWAPRSVRERHYLRVAPDFLIAAIHKAYRNDPVSVVKQSGRRVA